MHNRNDEPDEASRARMSLFESRMTAQFRSRQPSTTGWRRESEDGMPGSLENGRESKLAVREARRRLGKAKKPSGSARNAPGSSRSPPGKRKRRSGRQKT